MKWANKLEDRYRREAWIQRAGTRISSQVQAEAAVNAEELRDTLGRTLPGTFDWSPAPRVGVRACAPLGQLGRPGR